MHTLGLGNLFDAFAKNDVSIDPAALDLRQGVEGVPQPEEQLLAIHELLGAGLVQAGGVFDPIVTVQGIISPVVAHPLRMGGLGPVPAILVAAVEMITQFSLYWAGALPRMEWFLFIIDGAVMLAWFAIFFTELAHRKNGFKVSVRTCLVSAVTFVPAAYLSLLYLYEIGDWVMVLSVLLIVWGADISAYFSGRAWGTGNTAAWW